MADLMTADPVVLRPDDSIAVAINKMAVGGFRHIPLVVDGQATGIVCARDVFNHILAASSQRQAAKLGAHGGQTKDPKEPRTSTERGERTSLSSSLRGRASR